MHALVAVVRVVAGDDRPDQSVSAGHEWEMWDVRGVSVGLDAMGHEPVVVVVGMGRGRIGIDGLERVRMGMRVLARQRNTIETSSMMGGLGWQVTLTQ